MDEKKKFRTWILIDKENKESFNQQKFNTDEVVECFS